MAEIIEIITKYTAEVAEYKKAVDDIISQQNKFIANQLGIKDGSVNVTKTLTAAANSRKKLLEEETKNLKSLEAGLKTAFNIPQIKVFNEQIAQSKSNIALLKGETEKTGGLFSGLKDQLLQVGAGIAAAFSVRAIIGFAKDSVNAFQQAELNAKKLEAAVVNIGNEGSVAFERLIQQSRELQSISIFSDDDIQKAQTQLSQFGLLSNEIESLIPKIIDLASAQGIDLAQATDIVVQGINGVTRGLKPLGLEFVNTGNKAENLAIISEKLNKFQGQTATVLETSAGAVANLGNQFDDLKEKIGGLIASSTIFKNFTSAFQSFIDSFKSETERAIEIQGSALKSVVNGIEAEAEGILNAKIKQKEAFNELTEAAQEKFINDERLKILGDFAFKIAENVNKIAEETKKLDEVGIAPKSDANDIIIKQTKERIAALELESKALQIVIDKRISSTKTKQGITDEQQAKLDAEALAKKNKVLEAEKKLRQDLLNQEKQTQDAINKLKVETEPDVEAKLRIQKEIDAKLTETIAEDLRTRAQIELDLNQKKNDLLVLQNLKAFQEISKQQSGLSFAQDEKNLTDFINKRTSEILLSGKTLAQQEREITALQETELQIRLQNAKDFTGDKIEQEKLIAAATANIDKFILEQDKKLASDRLQVATELQSETNRARIIETGDGVAGIELRKQLAIEKSERELADAELIKDAKLKADTILLINQKLANDLSELNSEIEAQQIQSFAETFNTISGLANQLFSDIAAFQSAQISAQIDELEKLNEQQQTATDKELERLQKLNSDKLISQKDYDAQVKILQDKKLANEKKIQAEISALKKKQAEQAKALQIFEAIINTARAVAEALPNIPLSIAVGALGAVEVALILATPIPAFKKGTKGKQGSGLSLVGEEGAEVVQLPHGAQVLPHPQLKKNRRFIDAMFDNNLDDLIQTDYINPALIKETTKRSLLKEQITQVVYKEKIIQIAPRLQEQQSKNEIEKQKVFAQNIAQSFSTQITNTIKTDGIDEYGMMRALAKHRKHDKAFADYLAEQIVTGLSNEDSRYK